VEKGKIWEDLERTRKEMKIYMEKVKTMERELEDWKRREEVLKKEKKMKKRMTELEKRIEEKELKEKKNREEKREIEVEIKWEEKLRKLEKSMEGKEKEERRRRNIIIKGVSREKGDWRWECGKAVEGDRRGGKDRGNEEDKYKKGG